MPATIFALSSGRPPAGIAVIRISGPDAHRAAASLCGDLPQARQASVRPLTEPVTRELLDEGLVLRFDGPASVTGEDLVEFHCHGSRAVVDAVLATLATIEGLRPAQAGEFTRRAFENGRIDLTEAEGLADLLEAETEMQRRAALRIAEGGLRRQVGAWQDELVRLSAIAERAIDYAEEDEDGSDARLSADAQALAKEMGAWLARPTVEPLKNGLKVVLAGPPNSGKSSLLNAITGGDRVIVSDQPGTTRDVVEVPMAIDGLPFLFADTAGIRESNDRVESAGIRLAEGEARAADILLWLGAPGDSPCRDRVIRVHSKMDVRRDIPTGSWAVSSVTGDGIGALLAEVVRIAREMFPPEDMMALNRRQVASIRSAHEALLRVASNSDPALQAEDLRLTRCEFDRLTGRAGVEDVLDALFGRFCLGK